MQETTMAAPPARDAAHEPKADALTLARSDIFVNVHVALHRLLVAFRPESVALAVLLAGGGR